MILISTSHRPSPRTRSFIKDLVSVLPYTKKVNRGHKKLIELAIEAKQYGLHYVMIITERYGNPGYVNIYEIADDISCRLVKVATLVIGGVRLTRENPNVSRTYGASRVVIDFSKCITNDCFFIADLLIKVFNKIISDKAELIIKLEEQKYIELKCFNIHGNPVGPVIRISRVIRGGAD